MELFFSTTISNNQIELPETEVHHIFHVLKYKVNDAINITDGKGNFYQCMITEISKKRIVATIEKNISTPPTSFNLTIAIAPTKNRERIEWFLEKATELGVHKIIFIQTQFSEKYKVAHERLEKILIAAIKQSNQTWLPKLESVVHFEKMLQQKNDYNQLLICHNLPPTTQQILNVAKPNLNTLIAIGPEGGFSEKEVKQAIDSGFQAVLLGNNRLRTETAGLVAAAALQMLNSKSN